MQAAENNFYVSETQLNVFVENAVKALATIINTDGVTIDKIILVNGNNEIDIGIYINKNYSIKIITDNNIMVKKI